MQADQKSSETGQQHLTTNEKNNSGTMSTTPQDASYEEEEDFTHQPTHQHLPPFQPNDPAPCAAAQRLPEQEMSSQIAVPTRQIAPPRRTDHTYFDYSTHSPSPYEYPVTKKSHSNFPAKLHRLISDPANAQAIQWQPHGRAWKVLDKDLLVDVIIPKYFVQTKYESFTRQLSGWGFKRLHQTGPDYRCYYHECFLRGLPHLTRMMRRVEPNLGKLVPNVEAEPNFYEVQLTNPLSSSLPPAPTINPAGHAPPIWPPNNAPPNNAPPYHYGHHQGHELPPPPGHYPPPHLPHYDPNAYPPQQYHHPPFYQHMHPPYPPYHGGYLAGPPPPGQDHMAPPYPGYPGGAAFPPQLHPAYAPPQPNYANPHAFDMYPPHPGHQPPHYFDADPGQEHDASDNEEEKI